MFHKKRDRARAHVAGFIIQTVSALNKYGWTQGTMEDAQGRMCVLGALRFSSKTYSNDYHINKALLDSTYDILGSATDPINFVSWNDSVGQTADNVKQTLIRTAANVSCGVYDDSIKALKGMV